MRVIRWFLCTLITLCGVTGVAHADPPARVHRGRNPAPVRPSASVGWPNNGSLDHGRHLAASTSVRILPGRVLQWGTDELVGLLERCAARLKRQFQAPLTVGDLSARVGGRIARHRSHQSGRDADLAFFARPDSPRGASRPVAPTDYVVFDRTGRSLDGTLRFDTARNWALVHALLTDPRVRVERIFISSPLRSLLLQHARAIHASGSVITLAANTLVQPARVSPHDNHFHIRIVCPSGDRRCHTGVWLPPPPRRRRVAPLRRSRAATTHGYAPSRRATDR
ncbi:MAG: penicillin-insensitive murein endopeptidase [Deltaproteobacteria bacterium]|nr:penicillin-insensitive murein endopeptidase [Deltaproteobacteria bacterium]MBP6829143.1 penicillin-insensitive murein endopeptidase [Deltaproteobacteria bacterium]